MKEKLKRFLGVGRFQNAQVKTGSNILANCPGCSIEFPELISAASKLYSSTLTGKVKISEGSKLYSVLIDGNVSIGSYSIINGPTTEIHARVNRISIGNYCSIAKGVLLQEYFHDQERLTTYFILHHVFNDEWGKEITSKGSIEIGHDVWIGAKSIVLSGVKIGNGAIIAANSLINSDVPPFAIVGGSPAKIIKYRFTDEIRQKLIKLNWWEWPLEKVKRNKHLFESRLTDKALDSIK